MSNMPTSDNVNLLKQYAEMMGDCVAVYDPASDKLVEVSECFFDIVGIAPDCEYISQKWLSVIINPSENVTASLLKPTPCNQPVFFEYIISRLDGQIAHLRHTSICYQDNAQPERKLMLVSLRDCSHEYATVAKSQRVDWRQENNAQVRHFRKIVRSIQQQTNADFAMLAVPTDNHRKAKAIVAILDGEFLEELSYELPGTPCNFSSMGKVCIHKSGIQELYPEDLMLQDMGAVSYMGVPFFDDKGTVIAFFVVINRQPLSDLSSYRALFEAYQPQINRRLQLYFAYRHLADFGVSDSQLEMTDGETLMAAMPSATDLANWSIISEETFNSVKEAILITDKNNKIVQANQAFTDITGYTQAEVLGKDPGILSSGLHPASFYQEMSESLMKNGMWEGEIINKTKQGKSYAEWLFIRVVYNDKQEITNYIAVFSDISKHKEKEELLYFQANYDPLTMLPNRSLLFFLLAEAIASIEEGGQQLLHLLHVDLKGLARINENYNYNVGDMLLVETSNRLKQIVPDVATVARISGDNFVIMYAEPRIDLGVETVAADICRALAEPLNIEDLSVKITSNVGVASVDDSSNSPEAFFSMAEQALLRAKQEGQNKYFVFDEDLQRELKDSWYLEQELAEAIEKDQFVLYYQPQIDAESGRVNGVESLIRWRHPKRGLLSPIHFIPFAEKTNQIVPLGNLILKKACQQIVEWSTLDLPQFTVSVNISPRQFALESTNNTLQNIIKASGIDNSRIILEITEDVLMTDHADLLATLSQLRDSCIRFSLDDFGTGFSSLSYLQQYPLSELKIDRSFVSSLGFKPESHSIVKAIISMAKGLEMKVVAEGVETSEQRDILTALGCDFLQGYYFAKPMPGEELVAFINS